MTPGDSVDLEWLTSNSDTEEAAVLLAELVAIRSLPGEEAAIQERVAGWLSAHGMSPEIVDVVPGRPNVVLRVTNDTGPTLFLNGHVDTASIDPRWEPARLFGHRAGDRFYGLGAGDMKAGVVAAMLATRALHRSRDRWRGTLMFSSVIDEEAYSLGANALVQGGLRADYCVVTEASWERPCIGSFGKVLIRVDVTGKAAHASWPRLGVNAAVEASRFVARLGDVPLGQHPRIQPSQCVLSMQAGPDKYESIVVPESARVLINWHTVPGESAGQVIERMRSLVADLASPAEFTFSVEPPYYPAWETPVASPIVQAFSAAYAAEAGKSPDFGYSGYGDMNLFSVNAGMPTIMFGPLAANYHEADEWVDLPSIGATTRVLLGLACDLLPLE